MSLMPHEIEQREKCRSDVHQSAALLAILLRVTGAFIALVGVLGALAAVGHGVEYILVGIPFFLIGTTAYVMGGFVKDLGASIDVLLEEASRKTPGEQGPPTK